MNFSAEGSPNGKKKKKSGGGFLDTLDAIYERKKFLKGK